MVLHYCQMHGIASREALVLKDDPLGPLDRPAIDWKHLIGHAQQGIESRLDCVPAIDGNIAVKDLLQHLGVGDQALTLTDELLQ